jgi:hypothetical protein
VAWATGPRSRLAYDAASLGCTISLPWPGLTVPCCSCACACACAAAGGAGAGAGVGACACASRVHTDYVFMNRDGVAAQSSCRFGVAASPCTSTPGWSFAGIWKWNSERPLPLRKSDVGGETSETRLAGILMLFLAMASLVDYSQQRRLGGARSSSGNDRYFSGLCAVLDIQSLHKTRRPGSRSALAAPAVVKCWRVPAITRFGPPGPKPRWHA